MDKDNARNCLPDTDDTDDTDADAGAAALDELVTTGSPLPLILAALTFARVSNAAFEAAMGNGEDGAENTNSFALTIDMDESANIFNKEADPDFDLVLCPPGSCPVPFPFPFPFPFPCFCPFFTAYDLELRADDDNDDDALDLETTGNTSNMLDMLGFLCTFHI